MASESYRLTTLQKGEILAQLSAREAAPFNIQKAVVAPEAPLRRLEPMPQFDGPSAFMPQEMSSNHRESLQYPKPRDTSGHRTLESMAARPGIGRSSARASSNVRPSGGGGQSTTYTINNEAHKREWMASFCVEPEGWTDCEHVALATFLPCAMMGKTEWRLNQHDHHRDPLDSSWKAKYGCNSTCWVIGTIAFLFNPIIIPVWAAIHRTRVRKAYDLNGNCTEDFCRAFWLQPCTIVQTDREIRAREGEGRLRTNKKFTLEPISIQPAPVEPMRYVSPRATEGSQGARSHTDRRAGNSRWSTEHAMESRRAALERLTSEERASSSKIVKPHEPENTLKDKSNQGYGLRDYSSSRPGKEGKARASSRGNMMVVSVIDVDEKFYDRSTGLLKEGETPGSSKAPGGDHKLGECDTITISDLVCQHHSLQDCTPTIPYSSSKVQQHSLLDCDTATAKSSITLPQHILIDCETVTGKSSYSKPHHRLTSCTTAPSESLDLSYVHDFTDCPVDKSILAYFEKEEKRLQHAQGEGSRSPYIGDEDDVHEHRLESCPKIPIIRLEDTSQHHLVSCPTVHTIRPENPSQHRLNDCPTIPTTLPETPRGHGLSSCPTIPLLRPSNIYHQHRLVSCPDTTPAMAKEPLRQHRLDSCPLPASAEFSHKASLETLREHRFSSCPTPSSPDHTDKGKGKECSVGEHIHTKQCLKDGTHHPNCPGEVAELLQKISNVIEASTSIQMNVKTGEGAEDKQRHGNNNHRERRRRKSKSKVAEIQKGESSTSGERPRESNAQAALEKLLAAASQGAKKEAREKIGGVTDGRGFDENAS